MNFIKYIFIVFLLSVGFFAFGQRTETGISLTSEKSRLILEVENDLLFNTDNYYTAGLAISYTNKNFKKTPLQLILKSKSTENITFNGFGIEHRMFTPFSIIEPNAIENDRPYSAYFLLTNFSVLINTKKKLKLSNEIGIGVMGPVTQGEEIQTFVHELIDSDSPVGWEDQIGNTFLIDYQFRIEKGFFSNWFANHLTPFAAARVGTLSDKLQIGLISKIGNKEKFLSGTSTSSAVKRDFIWEWIFEANLQGVLFDATLEGSLFNEDEAVVLDKNETISRQYQLRTGLNLSYKKLSLRYMLKFNSSNFTTATIHRYGSVNIGLAF